MLYIPLKPKDMEQYFRGDAVYLGPTTPVNYRVMSTRVNPYSGELEVTGMREEEGRFPVMPSMFFWWAFMGIWNFLTGRLASWLFKIKPEDNPFKLQFHYGYAFREDAAPGGYKTNGNGNGRNGYPRNGNGYPRNGNGREKQYINDSWEKERAEELYPLD